MEVDWPLCLFDLFSLGLLTVHFAGVEKVWVSGRENVMETEEFYD